MREASTKPTAATVLPAPVACSNQKRLLALGSSGASATFSASASSGVSSQSCGSSSSSSSDGASPASSTGVAAGAAGVSPFLRRSASSAVSVPDSASTWWAESTVPSTSFGSDCESSRSRPSSSDHWRRQCGDGTFAPASSSSSAESSARRRGVSGASAVAASSPSVRKGSRANADARSISSVEGSVASSATGVVSAMDCSQSGGSSGRRLTGGRSRENSRAGAPGACGRSPRTMLPASPLY